MILCNEKEKKRKNNKDVTTCGFMCQEYMMRTTLYDISNLLVSYKYGWFPPFEINKSPKEKTHTRVNFILYSGMIKITEYDSSLLNFSLLLDFVRYRVIIP